MKFFKEESTTNVELMILGESSVNRNTEINHVKEEPKGNLEGLTEEEKKRLSVMVYESNSSTDKILNQGRRLMSFLDGNKEHKIVDVDIAEEFFHLESTDFSELCSKFSRLRPEKLFELYDEYRSMKVVDVGGYTVPWALASDLKMLLHKHGDIDLGADSNVTPRMKSFAATFLCAVVNKMRNSMAEDMTIGDLKLWFFCLNCAKKIAGYKVIRELDCFEESVMSTFLGFEAIKFEKEANESVDLKIAELEAELENWKGKRERLKELASTKSDFLKGLLRRASESKWKTVDKLF